MLDEVRQTLIDAGCILEAEGQGDLTRGHISVRCPDDLDLFMMKPHTFGFDEMTNDNLVICNLAGERVSGGPRHSEVFIHSEIFKARPDIHSVIHSHPTHAVAFSATGRALMPISQPAAPFLDGLPVYNDTINLIRSQELGHAVAKALGPHKAVLLRNHGVAVVGQSIAEAVILSIMLENACRIQLLCQAGGGAGAMFSAEDVQCLHDNITKSEQYAINFAYLRRRCVDRSAIVRPHG